ncbi:PQQ-binding-like beta-propeller repeat protein [bacterium]|nr:PQQ-binding-like beta-propeller repeat protein [bacterium]
MSTVISPGIQELPVTIAVALLLFCASMAGGAQITDIVMQDAVREAKERGGGLCVIAGPADASPALELALRSPALVQCLQPTDAGAAAVRAAVHARGAQKKISADRSAGDTLPYPDGTVNMLIAPGRPGLAGSVRPEEIVRVLAPRAVAYVACGAATADFSGVKLAFARLGVVECTVVDAAAGWAAFVKGVPPDCDEWEHFEHDAGRTSVSEDLRAGVPSETVWIAGEDWPSYLTFTGNRVGFASALGRNFYWVSDASLQTNKVVHLTSRLMCRDAYNGLLLWQREFAGPSRPTCMIASSNTLYLETSARELHVIDAASGATLRSAVEPILAEVMLLSGDVLVAFSRQVRVRALTNNAANLAWDQTYPAGWIRTEDGIAADASNVVFLYKQETSLLMHMTCRDLRSGQERWTANVDALRPPDVAAGRELSIVSCRDGIAMLSDAQRWWKPTTQCVNYAVSMADGSLLWTYAYPPTDHGGRATHVFQMGGGVWIKTAAAWVALDATTGIETRRISSVLTACYPDHATPRFILSGKMHFVDLAGSSMPWLMACRSGCDSGFMPANGLTYTFPTRCHCYPLVRGYLGMTSEPITNGQFSRLASSFKRIVPPADSPTPAAQRQTMAAGPDWPMYRGDGQRSASSTTTVPDALPLVWRTAAGSNATPVTIAGGRVFAALPDTHEVIALDEQTGTACWSFAAGGPVDTPPAYSDGRVVFGAADGRVYCLDATDGSLAWQFNAAPMARQIVVNGHLESAWPVHGAVLVQDGLAYVAAGRHSYLDSGLFLYALEMATGAVRWANYIKRPDPLTEDLSTNLFVWPELNDIMSSDGVSIYMGATVQLNPATGQRLLRGTGTTLWAPQSFLAKNADGVSRGDQDYWVSKWYFSDKKYRSSFDKVCGRIGAYSKGLRANPISFTATHVFGVRQNMAQGLSEVVGLSRQNFAALTNAYEMLAQDRQCVLATNGHWNTQMPPANNLSMNAMAATSDKLFVAGWQRDVNGVRTGKLWVFDPASGAISHVHDLPAVPLWDGLAVANSSLFITGEDGTVTKLGIVPEPCSLTPVLACAVAFASRRTRAKTG